MYRLKTLSLAKIKHLSWQNNTQISLYGQAPGCAVLSEHKADKIKGTVQSNAKKVPGSRIFIQSKLQRQNA
jgi:hypothetical protein